MTDDAGRPESQPESPKGQPTAEEREPSEQGPSGQQSSSDGPTSTGTRAATRPQKKRPGCLKVGCLTLVAMFLVIALAVGGVALYANHQLGKIQHSNSLLPEGGPSRDPVAQNAQNILLLGSDSRGTNLRSNGRSDVIQLMHVDSDRRSVQVVHFPRDLYVAIPGHGMNKINAAYAFGGPQLLVSTLQNLLNVHIDHVAQIGFEGFTRLTDAMGGVDVYVPHAYSEKDFGTWSQGYHHMNGKQALGFSRERHQLPRGDLDRGVDQQQWINSMVGKSLDRGTLKSPRRVLDMISAIAPYMLVDMSSSYLVKLAVSLRSIRRDDLSFYSAPVSGFATNSAGAVDVVDTAKVKQLGTALRTDRMSTTSATPNTIG